MKKIEFVEPLEFGVTTIPSKGDIERKKCFFAQVTWDDDSEESVYPATGHLVAYIENGFLAADAEKWYFYNVAGNIEKEIAKEELGECTEIGCMFSKDCKEEPEINLYFFEKAAGNESKSTRVYVKANGDILQPPSHPGAEIVILGMPVDQLINYNDEDWEDEDDNEEENDDWEDEDETPTCMELSRVKKAFKIGSSHLLGNTDGSAEK